VQALAKNGLPYLFGARRAYRPRILVKAKTLLFERQAAIGEQSSDLNFGVLDELLVEHTVNLAGLHGIEVSHELHVVVVVTADVREPIGEILTTGKLLFE